MSGALNAMKRFGRGWWKSLANNRLIEVPHYELGPHGDHDQWIAIGKHARELGVEPRAAKAMQRSYGFYLPRRYAEFAEPGDYLERGYPYVSPMMGAGDGLGSLQDIGLSIYRDLYGIRPDEAFDPHAFRDLIRIRQWPESSGRFPQPNRFSISPLRVDSGALRTISQLPEEIPEMRDAAYFWFENPESGGTGKLSLRDLMNLRDKRDLGFKRGGAVRCPQP